GGGEGVEPVGAAGGQDEVAAAAGECVGESGADSGAGSGDEDGVAGVVEGCVHAGTICPIGTRCQLGTGARAYDVGMADASTPDALLWTRTRQRAHAEV